MSWRHDISDKIETHRKEMLVERIMDTMDLIAEHLGTEVGVVNKKANGVDANVRRVYTGSVDLADIITSRLYEQDVEVSASATATGSLDSIGDQYGGALTAVNADIKTQQTAYAAKLQQIKQYAAAAQEAIKSGDRLAYETAKTALRNGLLDEYETFRPRLTKVANELTGVLSRIERSQKPLGINGPFSDSAINRFNSWVARTAYHVEGIGAKLFSPMYEARASMGSEADGVEYTQKTGGIGADAPYARLEDITKGASQN